MDSIFFEVDTTWPAFCLEGSFFPNIFQGDGFRLGRNGKLVACSAEEEQGIKSPAKRVWLKKHSVYFFNLNCIFSKTKREPLTGG